MLLGSTGKIHHSIVSRNKNAKYGTKKCLLQYIHCWCLYEQNDTDALLKNFLEMPMLWTREMSSRETTYLIDLEVCLNIYFFP